MTAAAPCFRRICVVNDFFFPVRHLPQYGSEVEFVGVHNGVCASLQKSCYPFWCDLMFVPIRLFQYSSVHLVYWTCAVSITQLCIVSRKSEVCFFHTVTPLLICHHYLFATGHTRTQSRFFCNEVHTALRRQSTLPGYHTEKNALQEGKRRSLHMFLAKGAAADIKAQRRDFVWFRRSRHRDT